MIVNEAEISEFVKSTLNGIKSGIEGENALITAPIKFNLAVTKIKEGSGGLKILVVDAGGKYKAEELTRIEFEVSLANNEPFGKMVYP